jgi:ATP-dependent Clp protease ATP-binding subunit ClpA
MWQHPLVQLLLLVLAAWMMLALLLKHVGLWAVIVVASAAGLLAVTIYLLRFLRPTAVQLYRRPVAKQWLDLVCRMTGQQVPIDAPATESALLLREPRDFEWARRKLNEHVKGQEAVVDLLVARLHENVLLRGRIAANLAGPPLGVFLFVGPPGIGKRHLALRLGQMLYRDGANSVLQVDQYGNDAASVTGLFGGSSSSVAGGRTSAGDLLALAKSQPNHTLVLENIDAAGPKLQDRLRSLFATGVCQDPSNASPVSCRRCLFILTTTHVPRGIDREKHATLSADQRHRALVETLAADTGLEPSFLARIQEVFLWDEPDDITKARVVLMLMAEECRKYHITLDYVAPEIIVEEVEAYLPAHGFAMAQTRIARRLRDPILKASQNQLDRLVLTLEMLSPLEPTQGQTHERSARYH